MSGDQHDTNVVVRSRRHRLNLEGISIELCIFVGGQGMTRFYIKCCVIHIAVVGHRTVKLSIGEYSGFYLIDVIYTWRFLKT